MPIFRKCLKGSFQKLILVHIKIWDAYKIVKYRCQGGRWICSSETEERATD